MKLVTGSFGEILGIDNEHEHDNDEDRERKSLRMGGSSLSKRVPLLCYTDLWLLLWTDCEI